MKSLRTFCLFLVLIQLALLAGCKKFVSVDPPITRLVTSSVFENDQTAMAAMNGIYSFMQSSSGFSSGATGSVGFLTGLSSDELTNYTIFPNTVQFYQNQLNRSNMDLYSYLWQNPYQCIYDANAVMEGIDASPTVSPGLRKEFTGEALFIRAFCHFYLTKMFGDIPLILSTDYKSNQYAKRIKRELVYQQIITDLVSARDSLSPDFSYSNGERVRPNSWAASAMLARVYLYAGDWRNAEAQSGLVIAQASLFSLLADLNQVFLANSQEAIWQLIPTLPGQNTGEGNIYILDSDPVYATLSPGLVNAFESGDLRRTSWVADTTIGTNTYSYAFKYKVKASQTLTEYSMVLRLAEQFLIRAEARVHLSDAFNALSDLNMIRDRAGLNEITTTDQDSLLKAIQHERQVELFTEWGHRWFDIIRTNTASDILSPLKPGWNATDTLYPIPAGEIQVNPVLTQNPGY